MIPISEVYGPVIQGEGELIGTLHVMVRVGGCDYRCSWCDTPWAVLPEHAPTWASMRPAEVTFQVQRLPPTLWVTLTGGNPALYAELGDVVDWCHAVDRLVAVETQGSCSQSWLERVDHLVVSPKPPSSGMDTPDLSWLLDLAPIGPRVELKFVVQGEADLLWAADIARPLQDRGLNCAVTVQPCGEPDDTTDDRLSRYRGLVSMVQAHAPHCRVLPQLHTLVWGNDRAR